MCFFHACYSCVLQFTSPTLTPTPISTLRVSRERAFEIYVNDPVLSDCLVLFHIHTHPINTAKRDGFAIVTKVACRRCCEHILELFQTCFSQFNASPRRNSQSNNSFNCIQVNHFVRMSQIYIFLEVVLKME